MNVQIQSVKFDADKKLIEFVENKMSKLERFADRATGAEVILKLDKDFEKQGSDHHAAHARRGYGGRTPRPRLRGGDRRGDRRTETPDREIQGEGEIAARRHACDGRSLRRGFLPFAFPESAPAASAAIPLLYEVPAACEKTDTMPVGGGGWCNPSATFFRQNVQPADFLFIFASKTFLKRSMFSNRTAQNWWWRSLVLSKQ